MVTAGAICEDEGQLSRDVTGVAPFRAVSQLENYLVELLREIAKRNLAPFMQQDKMLTFSQAHLLSFETADRLREHILDGECRSLNGKGFREFEKYYKRRFNIEFSQAPVSVAEVDEIYARRHILVHAGGQVDEQYCRRFGSMMQPGERLQITEQYFLDATKKLESLAEYCAGRVEVLFPDPARSVPPPIERLLEANQEAIKRAVEFLQSEEIPVAHWISATFVSTELLEDHFAQSSTFGFGASRTAIEALIIGRERLSDTTMHWLVCAAKPVVGAYIGYITYMERKGMIEKLEKHNIPLVQAPPNWKRPQPNEAPEANAPETGAPLS